jgi:hypothetical protein
LTSNILPLQKHRSKDVFKTVQEWSVMKSTHFIKGQQCGYLACVIPEEKHQIVILDPVWVYAALVNPDAYAVAALTAGVSVAHLGQIAAKHKET